MTKKRETVGAQVETAWEWPEHFDALAARWSEEQGRQVTRSDVIRALLADGLERNPVTDDERETVRRGRPRKSPPAREPMKVLRLVTSGEGSVSPRGVDPLSPSYGQGALELNTKIAA